MSLVTVTTLQSEVDAEQVVTLREAKDHLRVTSDSLDDRIVGIVDAAISWAEDHARRPIRRARYLHVQEVFDIIVGRRGLRLPGLIASIDGLQVKDSDGVLGDVAGPDDSPGPALYEVVLGQHAATIREVTGQSLPDEGDYADAVQVTFTAGWTGSTVPHAIKQAILSKAGEIYYGDESSGRAAEALLGPWRLPPW